jgi:hypothetical protein
MPIAALADGWMKHRRTGFGVPAEIAITSRSFTQEGKRPC